MAEIKLPIQVNLPDDWIEQIVDRLKNDPDADWVKVTRCKDCKYFELNHFKKVEGSLSPIITAHEICMKWGKGCKSRIDGWCFMAERKTDG